MSSNPRLSDSHTDEKILKILATPPWGASIGGTREAPQGASRDRF